MGTLKKNVPEFWAVDGKVRWKCYGTLRDLNVCPVPMLQIFFLLVQPLPVFILLIKDSEPISNVLGRVLNVFFVVSVFCWFLKF